ncbi:MAG TPA: hypothetical protein VF077_00365 [Nitrospiraceae bacterium]
MTRLEAQTLIEQRLGKRTGLKDDIVGELRAAQRHFERKGFLPWFLRTTAIFPFGEKFMPLPTGFLREVDDEHLFALLKGTEQKGLKKRSYQQIAETPGMGGLGEPRFYTLEFDQNQPTAVANFWPQPDTTYMWRLCYNRTDLELVADNSENRWLTFTPELLVCKAGLEIAKMLRSVEGTQLFMTGLAEAQADMRIAHVAQMAAAVENWEMRG